MVWFSPVEIHNQFVLYTDASSFAWESVFEPSGIPVVASDYWPNVLTSDIAVKEALALSNALESFKSTIKDSRIDVYVDSLALFHSWNGQSAYSRVQLRSAPILRTVLFQFGG